MDFILDQLIVDAKKVHPSDTVVERTESTLNEKRKTEPAKAKESHYVGRGTDFHRVLFHPASQSPLVSHYLKLHQVHDSNPESLGPSMTRKEISRLPPVTLTYQDVITEAQKFRRKLQKDYIGLQDRTQKQLAEIQQQQVNFNRKIERLKKKISHPSEEYNIMPKYLPEVEDVDATDKEEDSAI
ncbi:protein FAM227B-like isoform X2 [Protopterus annectens]|uniref:protein FAM227B-like isoform X2 n=1 Tax=Protopterus annectens TaxID=7888 RepID=UPI001CFAF861|nr:protein FAM227B-like isoform X2 [Protopterus annectens]